MSEPSVTALVPMKHHSERVPGKNYRSLCGKPLLHWIMDALMSSRFVRDIVVNTDSDRVATEVARYGATVLPRPDHLLGDMVTIQPLLEWDLAHTDGDLFLQTHSTNPLLTADTIDRAIETFHQHPECDSLFSVTPLRTRLYWPDGSPVNHDPGHLIRTQDLQEIFEENSCMYVFSRDVFERCHHRIGERPLMFRMDPLEAVDIDEEQDFILAEALLQSRLARDATVGKG